MKLFAFLHFFSPSQLLLILDATYDSLNEDALLRSLIKSHRPCFEKLFQWFHNVQLKLFIDISKSYFTRREKSHFNLATYNLPGFSSINRLFRENIENILARKQNAPKVWYVTSHLVVLYRVSSNCGNVVKMASSWMSH